MGANENINKYAVLIVAALSFTAIGAVAMHSFGWLHLYYSARLITIPAFALIACFGLYNPVLGRKILMGWLYGIVAVTIYDLSRVPFMIAGWGDFIPGLGEWITGQENAPAAIGYAWRWIGNGGGLGIAFVVLNEYFKPKGNRILLGLVYGLFVYLCLDAVLILAPGAQELMFELTTLNAVGSLVGHVVYGVVLGWMYYKKPNLEVTSVGSPSIAE